MRLLRWVHVGLELGNGIMRGRQGLAKRVDCLAEMALVYTSRSSSSLGRWR